MNKYKNTEIRTAIIRGMELITEAMEKKGLLTDETTWNEFGQFAKSISPIEVVFEKEE